VLFVLAGLFRLASAYCLSRQSEPESIPWNDEPFSAALLVRKFREGSGAPLLIYLCIVQATVQFAGPYFAPFMFQKLNFSYAQFVVLIATSFVAKIISLPLWGHFAHRIGAFRLLWVGGVGIVPISAMWLVSDNLYWLMVVQLVGGVAWAAYELAFALLFFESIPERERTGVLTVYNLANTTAWVSGSLLGGFLLSSLGTVKWAYYLLFALSSVGRGFALILLKRVAPISVQEGPVGMRTIGLEPSAGSIDTPILPSLPDQAPVVKAEELVPVCETEQAA
jgi:MFS family permease